jgi:transcriptional regulator with XRE-family HTH domain
VDEDLRGEVGRRVASKRKARGWTQQQLADEAGVSRGTVVSIEAGRAQNQPPKLASVLEALGMNADTASSPEPDDAWPQKVRIFARVIGHHVSSMPEKDQDKAIEVLMDLMISGRWRSMHVGDDE